jgi:hypothetical protein
MLSSTAGRIRPSMKEKSMSARTSILVLAIASLFATAGTALAYGPGPQAGMGPRAASAEPAQRVERLQTRLAELKEALKLQPGQLEAWNTYEARVTAAAQSRAQMRQSMLDSRGDAQAMADQRVAMMKHNAAAAEEVNELRKALVATLTPEQRRPSSSSPRGTGLPAGRAPQAPGTGTATVTGPVPAAGAGRDSAAAASARPDLARLIRTARARPRPRPFRFRVRSQVRSKRQPARSRASVGEAQRTLLCWTSSRAPR